MIKNYQTTSFAESIAVKVRSLWGTLKVLIERVKDVDDGTYVLLRDANKPVIHVYAVSDDEFAHEQETAVEGTQTELT